MHDRLRRDYGVKRESVKPAETGTSGLSDYGRTYLRRRRNIAFPARFFYCKHRSVLYSSHTQYCDFPVLELPDPFHILRALLLIIALLQERAL